VHDPSFIKARDRLTNLLGEVTRKSAAAFVRRWGEAVKFVLSGGRHSSARMSIEWNSQSLQFGSNPQPSGFFNDKSRECLCTPPMIQHYVANSSEQPRDRIDICIGIPAVNIGKHTGFPSLVLPIGQMFYVPLALGLARTHRKRLCFERKYPSIQSYKWQKINNMAHIPQKLTEISKECPKGKLWISTEI
jgi:hypothetical protein